MATPASDPHGICVAPHRFGEHLRLLVDRYHPVSLTELLDGLDSGDLPTGAVALTFDDGYADNALAALPLLREFQVPATVFVATANLGTEAEFWWDRLEAVFLSPGTLPRRISMRTGARPFLADLGSDREYSDEDSRRHAGWAARSDPPPTRRHHTYLRLFRRIQRLGGPSTLRLLDKIEAWSGRSASQRETHRCVGADDLVAMTGSGLIEIGAHSVHHPRLSKLPKASRLEEISTSRSILDAAVGPIQHFAYPFGDDAGSASLVRTAGFRSACITQPAPVTSESDRHRLPRVYVGDWPAGRLAMRLAEV